MKYYFSDTMLVGFGTAWPEQISDVLAKRENGLEYTGLTDYYRLLDEYLDNQLDPSNEEITDDYIEPPVEEENEIPEETHTPKDQDKSKNEDIKTHDDIHENIIDTDEEHNFKYETSTVGVLEIKNPVAAGDQPDAEIPKEASYNLYWWIGVAVALTVVVLLVAIIARKRHSHRKQLERQRRQNTHA